jgi:hypothetical protein
MIEFITLSNNSSRVSTLERSLHEALGGETWRDRWRLTVVDGSKYDLFTGYNAGAAQTSGEHLAFIHDDTQILGNPLTFDRPLRMLGDPAVGFIGIVGVTRLNNLGCWWGDMPQTQMLTFCRGLVACGDDGPFRTRFVGWPGPTTVFGPGNNAVFGQVLVVDGVLLMCHRRTLDKLGGFDEKNFKGFHFYDIDVTFRAHLAGLKNFVAPLPLLHESLGTYDDAWETARQTFVRKFSGKLPFYL